MEAINQTNANNSDEDDVELLKFIVDEDDSTSSSSESSDDEILHPKINNFVTIIDEFNEMDFRSHLRLQRSTAQFLIVRFESYVASMEINARRPPLPAKTAVYMYLWYISNTVTYRQLAILFGVTKSTAWLVVRRVVQWIISISHEFVVWPTGQALQETCNKFEEKKGIPNVAGAIDCTHITIIAPNTHKENYFNRKKTYSLVLQAIVDADKKFIDLYCGEPGSMHDSRVLRRSKFYSDIETNKANMLPNDTFILGDSAYKCKDWLITPFKDNGRLTNQQRQFNYIHSATRIVVENTFAALKGKFRRLLKFTEHRDLCAVTNLIMSACVLHNICIVKEGNDDLPEESTENYGHEESEDIPQGQQRETRRDKLFNDLIHKNII